MNHGRDVTCVLWNAASLNNKLNDFISLLEDEDLDVAAVTETWLSSQNNNTTSELRERGYSIYHFNRDHDVKKGGGVALVFKNSFKFISGKTFACDSFEGIVVSIAGNTSRKLNFIVIYRFCEVAPTLFLSDFYKFIKNIFINLKNLIILGDFNLHVNEKSDPNVIRFYDILSSFSLNQIVEGPTHKRGNTLDLVIHNVSDTIIKDLHVDFNNRSDHAYIYFKLCYDVDPLAKKTITIQNLRSVNLDIFKSDISLEFNNFDFNTDNNFFDMLNNFNNLCKICVDKHVETKEITINKNVKPKWVDSEFREARAQRRKLYKRWKRTKTAIDRSNFEHARKRTQDMSIDKRSKFYATAIDNCNNSHKELFQISKNLLDKSNSTVLPLYESPTCMANKFNNYFISKIENIRSSFPNKSIPTNGVVMDTYNGAIMSEFKLTSAEKLKKVILSKPIKTSPQDPLPAVLLKACIDVLLPVLVFLVNLSLSICSMDGLKDTVVTPLLKKAGLDPEVLKNYRPVSNILYLSKMIEREVLIQCNEHLDLIGAHTANQSGYKPKHSCETLLLRVINDIMVNIDNSLGTIMLLLDLSAAFDTVDHAVLLDILWFELGIRGKVYKWFVEFLRDRRQSVGIDGQKSSLKECLFGVPQGSVIGPFLFNIYVRNLIKTMEEAGFTIHGYADDHQILFSFKIDFQVAAIRSTIPQGLDIISRWMNRHFLKLNPSKSQVIIFYPKAFSNELVFEQLLLSDGSYIPISTQVYNLGFTLDSLLTFTPHVSLNISQGYHLIRNIASIRKYLSVDHLKTLVNSVIVAKTDNCNSLLYGISAYDTDRLQKFQNSCARLIYKKRKYDRVSGLLRELHWLPSEVRTYFKLLCYVFKSIHDLAPSYLSDLTVVARSHDLRLAVPRRCSKIGDRAFSSAGPRLWNALPTNIRVIATLERFKSQLKHFLFNSFHLYKQKINIYRS